MKKLAVGVLTLSLLSSSAFAWWTGDSKITGMELTGSDSSVVLTITDASRTYTKPLPAGKEVYAMALTAMTAESTLQFSMSGGNIVKIRMK